MKKGMIKYVADFKEKDERKAKYREIVMEGHNDILPIPALRSDQIGGGKRGDDIEKWMLKQLEV